MVRFSCFHSPAQSHKSKKTVHLSTESMQKTLEDYPASQTKKNFAFSTEVPPKDSPTNSSSSIVQDSKSEGFKSVNDAMSDEGPQNIKQMRKSISLGSGLLEYKGRSSVDECSFSSVQNDEKFHKTPASYSIQLSSNIVNHESVFSIECPQQSEKEICENSETRFSGEVSGNSSNHTPRAPPAIVKSRSLPFLHSFNAKLIRKSRSSDDLKALDSKKKDETFNNEESQLMKDHETGDDNVVNFDKNQDENHNPVDDNYDAYHYVGSAKDWIVPAVDELDKGKKVQEDYSVCRWEELPNKDFKVKRITKWVMDLQHCPLEETDGPRDLDHLGRNGHNGVFEGLTLTSSRNDVKALPAMDSVKKYISSLSPLATAAQLTNHGLVVIPFLSAFSSLKALNLSGNAIVRITAGALPRGLHILNLSKNSISTIEGLRELTRLRVLDLSYNRILRIGHGLASCSSLKELYLAGNKISEVEGLHRLLKLNVLDLRFNKLSTTKNLGQLAANYNSLQAISLEGNPAQKNIGDEHLKKYLLGLLPHLAYLNRQSIKAGSIKDSADRAARLGISAHQIDRGLRSESKRKSTHGRKSQPVATRGRHARLPPTGIKMTMTNQRQHFQDLTSKVMEFRSDLAIRRTRSEGLLGAI